MKNYNDFLINIFKSLNAIADEAENTQKQLINSLLEDSEEIKKNEEKKV